MFLRPIIRVLLWICLALAQDICWLPIVSTQTNANAGPVEEVIPWHLFLEAQPPGQVRKASGMAKQVPTGFSLMVPKIQLYCDSDDCGGLRFFVSDSDGGWASRDKWREFPAGKER